MDESPRLLDLRGVEPAPDRLLEIARAVALRDPGRAIAVEWGFRFPWSRGVVRTGHELFPEKLVAKVIDALASEGASVLIVLSRLPPPDSRLRGALRHLERAARGVDEGWERALAKHIADLYDDAVELAPATAGFAAPVGAPHASAIRKVCGERAIDFFEVSPGEAEVVPSLEITLARRNDPLAPDRSLAVRHDEIASLRTAGWRLVADAHESLVCLGEGAYRTRAAETASLLRELAIVLRDLARRRDELEDAYRGIAVSGSASREVERVIRPLREQHSNLRARLSTVRSLE